MTEPTDRAAVTRALVRACRKQPGVWLELYDVFPVMVNGEHSTPNAWKRSLARDACERDELKATGLESRTRKGAYLDYGLWQVRAPIAKET